MKLFETPAIFLITGLMAAGKSSVAQALAERLTKSVHLRGDLFRRLIVNGRVEMGFDLSEEALAQLNLRYDIAVNVAKMYLASGFTVVYQDIILGQTLEQIVRKFQPAPLYVVVLCPNVDAIVARELGRGKRGYHRLADVASFDRVLREETPRLGLWLDTSVMTVEQTVDEILAQSLTARIDAAHLHDANRDS